MFDWSQLPVIQVPVKPYYPLRRALLVGAGAALVVLAVVVGCA
jgi:hypothetical protein